MKKEITTKLNKLLLDKEYSKENEITYLMVETRKLLEIMKDKSYPLLRFYCDWTLHYRKDKITPDIKQIIKRIDESIPKDTSKYAVLSILNRANINFIYMKELQKELKLFLKQINLPLDLVGNKNEWISFVKALTKILANQPIMNPIDSIESFSFVPAREGATIWIIKFKDERGECKFGNIY